MISRRLLAITLAVLAAAFGTLLFGYFLPEAVRLDGEIEESQRRLQESERQNLRLAALQAERDRLQAEIDALNSREPTIVGGTAEEVAEWLANELRSAGIVLISLRPLQEGTPAIDLVAQGSPSAFGRLFISWRGLQSDWEVRTLTMSRQVGPGVVRATLRLIQGEGTP